MDLFLISFLCATLSGKKTTIIRKLYLYITSPFLFLCVCLRACASGIEGDFVFILTFGQCSAHPYRVAGLCMVHDTYVVLHGEKVFMARAFEVRKRG